MLMPIVRAWGDFPIATVQDNRQVDPRMVMERPVVIRAQHLVEVDVDEPISRDHPPATHVGVLLATHDEVRRTAINNARMQRSEERSVGKEWGSSCRYRWLAQP